MNNILLSRVQEAKKKRGKISNKLYSRITGKKIFSRFDLVGYLFEKTVLDHRKKTEQRKKNKPVFNVL